MTVVHVTKLELHPEAFRAILHSDQVNAQIRSAGKLIENTSRLHVHTHVARSTTFKDGRQIGFVGGTFGGKTQAAVEKDTQKLANAVQRRTIGSL